MNERSRRFGNLGLADPEPSLGAVLDAMPRPLVVLEADGRVLAANRCWREGATPTDPTAMVSAGDDFPGRCDSVAAGGGELASSAARISEGARQVLAGRVERCEVPYGVDRDRKSWMLIVISRIPHGAVIARIDPEVAARLPEPSAELAFHDAATGLPNPALVLDRIKMAMIRAERSSSWPAVLLVELGGLDELGRSAADDRDRALAEVGQRLAGALREGDTCGRWGDHELVLLAELTEPSALSNLVARVQASLVEPVAVPGRAIALRANIGVVLAHGSERVDQLIQLAEAARREAARTGEGVSVTHSLGA